MACTKDFSTNTLYSLFLRISFYLLCHVKKLSFLAAKQLFTLHSYMLLIRYFVAVLLSDVLEHSSV